MRIGSMPAFVGAVCLLVPFSVSAVDVKISLHSATTISSITPRHVAAKKQASVIVTGKHLDKVGGCTVQPVNADVAQSQYSGCTARSNKAGSQLILGIDQTLIPTSGDYLVLLTDTEIKAATDKGLAAYNSAHLLAFGKLHVDGASGSVVGGGTNSGGGADTVHPYTDCLNELPENTTVGGIPAPSTGVLCGSSIVPDTEVSDEFGYHVSKLYTAIQVRVSNKNSQYDFLLRDIVLTLPDGRVVSGRIRRFAQGVAVKGKTHDRRSVAFNTLTAIGGVYGALASFGSVGFTTAGNVLQGAFMGSFNQIYPDYTADNVNRFNNAVFDDQNPSIVPKDSIGQPPLYVIALVPKEPGLDRDIAFQEAKSIQVSIEGTFIKQIVPIEISRVKEYQPQLISPQSFKDAGFDFKDLLKTLESQQIVISNKGANSMTIHGYRILPDGKSTGKDSPDFDVDLNNSTCGTSGTSKDPADEKTVFSIPPQSACYIGVLFHPTVPGQVSATLRVDGDNLDGDQTAKLTGTGIGLILRASTIDSPPTYSNLDCDFNAKNNCVFDIGLQKDNDTATVSVYYYSALSTTDKLTVIQTQPKPDAPLVTSPSPITSLGANTDAGPKDASATFSLPINQSVPVLADGKHGYVVTFSDDSGALPKGFPVTIEYETQATSLANVQPPPPVVTAGSPPDANAASVTLKAGGKGLGGQTVIFTVNNNAPNSAPTPPVQTTTNADGKATLDLSHLAPGTYTVTAAHASQGDYAASKSVLVGPVTVTLPTAPPPASPSTAPAATNGGTAAAPGAKPVPQTQSGKK